MNDNNEAWDIDDLDLPELKLEEEEEKKSIGYNDKI